MHIRTVKSMSNSVFQILLLLVSLTVQASGAVPRLARPNCAEMCGNITIPFPFGIGRECFLDDWYEIVCQQNKTIPILKKIGLRVLDILLPTFDWQGYGVVKVSLPVIYSNASCQGNGHGEPVSLEGSKFVFSQSWNFFTLVGCDAEATVISEESTGIVFTSTGCRSKCDGTNTNISWSSACSGRDGCCQTTIPLNLQAFSVDIKGEGKQQGCKYAFLADTSWFSKSDVTGLYDLRVNDTVPVVLQWGIQNDTDYSLALQNQSMSSDAVSCYISSLPYVECWCLSGYHGNPYFIGGCQDIDECEDSNICHRRGRTCVNKEGSYDCVDGRKKALIGLGAGVGGLVQVLLLSRWLYRVVKKRREIKQKEKYFKTQWGLLLQRHLSSSPEGNVAKSKLFHFKDLEKATDRFNKNRILGQGGQGVVYKGMLTCGKIVAVKKSKLIDKEKVEEFINEFIILSQINHRNVVKLMGCCLETDIPLLVYEFIPNGTLYKYLHDPNEDLLASWDTRLRIATEIAGALFYLHSAASIPIYHRDIKSTNILLDEKHHAKVADFGTSKSVSLDQTHVTTLVRGTFGYLDPEYFRTGHFTDKSDVYSFGVVLVELLTGQTPMSLFREEEEERSLATYFVISIEQNCLFDIADARVMEEGKKEEIVAVANLARRCLSSIGRNRPTMREVAMELEGVRRLTSSSSFQQIEETIEAAKSRDSSFMSGKSFVDIGVTTFSDVQPFACESW
ncbi:wall-associated receptor kinase-like 22 [Eucalyptus grandis]|uniref:wall-associated receptor kinase-like 22 n=1 Tax=Eucalyptus grandis TaxID=71139 RepID=UPI00192EB41D|nr:wall-associated receptor kinase-like 22 [Eucalyptus grandis]